jgi:hypothetical protein
VVDRRRRATASLGPTLFLDDMAGMCGRVELRYLDEAGKLVDTVDGAEWCPTTNADESHTQTLAAAPSSQILQVEVAMQTSPNVKKQTWSDVTSQTKSIAETG